MIARERPTVSRRKITTAHAQTKSMINWSINDDWLILIGDVRSSGETNNICKILGWTLNVLVCFTNCALVFFLKILIMIWWHVFFWTPLCSQYNYISISYPSSLISSLDQHSSWLIIHPWKWNVFYHIEKYTAALASPLTGTFLQQTIQTGGMYSTRHMTNIQQFINW